MFSSSCINWTYLSYYITPEIAKSSRSVQNKYICQLSTRRASIYDEGLVHQVFCTLAETYAKSRTLE